MLHRLPRDHSEAFIDAVLSTHTSGASVTTSIADRGHRVRLAGAGSPYGIGDLVAKALDQIGKTAAGEVFANDQDVFDKVSQSLNSAHRLLSEAHYAAQKNDVIASFVLPFVVVPPERLWAVDYDETGKVISAPHLESHVSLFVGKAWTVGTFETYTLSHVEICEIDKLGALLAQWQNHAMLTFDKIWSAYRNTSR